MPTDTDGSKRYARSAIGIRIADVFIAVPSFYLFLDLKMKMSTKLSAFVLVFLAFAAISVAQESAQTTTKQAPDAKHQMNMLTDMPKQMRMMNEMMVKKLAPGDRDYEKRFIDLMIPHHEGAIAMATDALKNAQQPEIKAMAEKMIQDQKREIEELKNLRAKWYGNDAR